MDLWELIVCNTLGFLLKRCSCWCLCLLHMKQRRGHYSCLMAHFPTSACCSPEAHMHADLSLFSSLMSFSSFSDIFPSCHCQSPFNFFSSSLLCFYHVSFSSKPLCPLVNSRHFLSLSHLVPHYFIIRSACCLCTPWAIMAIIMTMTAVTICHVKMLPAYNSQMQQKIANFIVLSYFRFEADITDLDVRTHVRRFRRGRLHFFWENFHHCAISV